MEPSLVTAMAALVGLAIGSFLNVAILRGARGESLGGRTHCESCQKTLSASELIPIISFMVLRGRCRYCGTALLFQYPLVEGTTSASFAITTWLVFSRYPFGAFSWILLSLTLVAISSAIVTAVSDLKYYLVPDLAVLILVLAGVAITGIRIHESGSSVLFRETVNAVTFPAFFASLWYFSKGKWMGFGDAKIVLGTSLVLGFPASLVGFLFAFWLGTLGALPLLLIRRKKWGEQIPFGPYLLLGALLAFFCTEKFLNLTGLELFF